MNIKLILIVPVIMGFTYCSTTPSVTASADTDISYSVDHEAAVLESVRIMIEDGSLSSLDQAVILLENESAGTTEQGEVLKFIAASILKLVYPYSETSNIRVASPKSGVLAEIVESAGEGIIIDIPNEDVSFFTLLLSSTAALFTESDAVIDRSLEILETIYSSESISFLPVYIRACLFEKQKLFSKALEGYYEAGKLDGKSYPAQLGIVRILIRNGEYREALFLIEKLYSLYSQHIEVCYLFVDILIGSNELERALLLVTDSLSVNPDDMTMTLKYADILQKRGQNAQAIRMLKVIESVAGPSKDSVRIRGSILINEKNYSQAAALLKDAVYDYPDDSGLRALYGSILLITGDEGEGRLYLEDSLEANPDSLGSLVLLTEEAISAGDWIRATDLVEKLLAKDDSDIYLRYAVKIYQNLGDSSKVFALSTRIIEEGQPLYSDYTVYIDLLLREGNVKASLEMTDRWLKASSSPVERSHFYYLKSLAQTDTGEKLDSLRQSLFENLQNLDAIMAIADAYYDLGEKRKSYRYLKQAFIMDPDDNQIRERLRKLEMEL